MKKRNFCVLAAVMLLLTGCGNKTREQLESDRDAGIAYMDQAQYEQAVTSFESAYALCDEKMPETKTDISLYEAACQMKLEDYESVKNTCTRILELGENAEAYYMRGVAFLKLGDTDAAKADFDGAAVMEPNDYEMFLNIYQQYEAINQSAVGDQYLQQVLNNESTGLEDDYQKGSIYYYLGDYEKAATALARPVEAKKEDAMRLMGQVYLAQGDTQSAWVVYQQYKETFGETAESYNGIALCDIADGDYDTALQDIQQGLSLDVSDSSKRDLLYNEIVVYEKKMDFATAKQKAEEFMQLYPDDEVGQKEYDFLITR